MTMSLALNKPNKVVTLRTNYKVKEEITKLNLECPEFGSGVPYNPALVYCIMCERFADGGINQESLAGPTCVTQGPADLLGQGRDGKIRSAGNCLRC